MKSIRIIAVLLAVVSMLALTSCGPKKEPCSARGCNKEGTEEFNGNYYCSIHYEGFIPKPETAVAEQGS